MEPFMDALPIGAISDAVDVSEAAAGTGVVECVKDNLLDSDCQILLHACNCWHTMGAGIAREIKQRYPEAFTVYCETPYGDRRKLGCFSIARAACGRIIVNMYVQFEYGRGRQIDYGALAQCLARIRKLVRDSGRRPRVGSYWLWCYHAGGDVVRVQQIMAAAFSDYPLFVYSVPYPGAPAMAPPRLRSAHSEVVVERRHSCSGGHVALAKGALGLRVDVEPDAGPARTRRAGAAPGAGPARMWAQSSAEPAAQPGRTTAGSGRKRGIQLWPT